MSDDVKKRENMWIILVSHAVAEIAGKKDKYVSCVMLIMLGKCYDDSLLYNFCDYLSRCRLQEVEEKYWVYILQLSIYNIVNCEKKLYNKL